MAANRPAAGRLVAGYGKMLEVAEQVVGILEREGFTQCCFVGSMACKLHGNTRKPNDLDLLVMHSSVSAEEIKALIVENSGRDFRLVDSVDPGATYKKLYHGRKYRIKVDILLADQDLDFPTVDDSDIVWINRIPVAPVSLALLHKLKSWEDHRLNPIDYYNQKQFTDVRDIDQMLQIAISNGLRPTSDGEPFLYEQFLVQSRRRVRLFVQQYPDTKPQWRALGFNVEPRSRRRRRIFFTS